MKPTAEMTRMLTAVSVLLVGLIAVGCQPQHPNGVIYDLPDEPPPAQAQPDTEVPAVSSPDFWWV